MNDIEEVKKLLALPKEIAIITHRNPDGDALGSSLAMKLYLEKEGHNAKVILPSEYPKLFRYLPKIDECQVFDLKHDEVRKTIAKAEIIICLDFNGLDRIDKLGQDIKEAKAKKMLIDHHLDPEPFADYAYSDTSASSTCEMVYLFLEMLGEDHKIDTEIGTCLFTGIITDTGSFKYATNPNTYTVAAKLKAKGVDDYDLNDKIFNCYNEKQLRLLGHCINNRLEVIPEYGAGIITLTRDDYAKFEIVRGDTEGIVNYILMMEGISVAAFIREQPQVIKLSLRSKGDISVQALCRNHFNGGGHKNASGGHAYAKLSDIVNKFKEVLPKYTDKRVL